MVQCNYSKGKEHNTVTGKGVSIMWSFEIRNKATGERDIIFGYRWSDAVRRSGINEDEWDLIRQDYED